MCSVRLVYGTGDRSASLPEFCLGAWLLESSLLTLPRGSLCRGKVASSCALQIRVLRCVRPGVADAIDLAIASFHQLRWSTSGAEVLAERKLRSSSWLKRFALLSWIGVYLGGAVVRQDLPATDLRIGRAELDHRGLDPAGWLCELVPGGCADVCADHPVMAGSAAAADMDLDLTQDEQHHGVGSAAARDPERVAF